MSNCHWRVVFGLLLAATVAKPNAPVSGETPPVPPPASGNNRAVAKLPAPADDRRSSEDSADQPVAEFRPVRISIHAVIDGSDVLEISDTHAFWRHRNWGWSNQPVIVNDIEWRPREQAALPNAGKTQFLLDTVDFRTARLENVNARDTVVLEPRNDSVRVHLADTPNGAAVYEFDIVFDPPAPPPVLHVTARIDGSDRLVLTAESARWEHRHWNWPTHVTLNGVSWNPRQAPQLNNPRLLWRRPVDFRKARLEVRSARDLVVLERRPEMLILNFADNPLGSAVYDVIIRFD